MDGKCTLLKVLKPGLELVESFSDHGFKSCSKRWTCLQQNREDGDFNKGFNKDGDFHKGFNTHRTYCRALRWLTLGVRELPPAGAQGAFHWHHGALTGWLICRTACLLDGDKVLNSCHQSITPSAAYGRVYISAAWALGTLTAVTAGESRGGELSTSAIGPLLFDGERHPCALGQAGRWCKWSLQPSFPGEETAVQRLQAEGHAGSMAAVSGSQPVLSPFKNIALKHWAITHNL